MKNTLIFLTLYLTVLIATGQEKLKFGTVSPEELEMTSYSGDSLAPAVVLHESCDIYFTVLGNNLKIVTKYTVRIKILTGDGVELANRTLNLFKGKTRDMDELYSGLTGFTYNLENGKIRKDKLSKDYIFTENISKNQQRIKFALPAVKVGSVFEYTYTVTSPYYYDEQDYKFQRNIPVEYSYFTIKIPEYFIFDREIKGYEPLHSQISKENQTLLFDDNKIQCSAQVITIEAKKLPALKADDFVYHYQDHLAGIRLELKKIAIPGSYYKDFSTTWDNVVEQLNENSFFGKQLNYKNLFKNEMPTSVNTEPNEKKKIKNILDIVRTKVKWDKTNTLYIKDPKKALKEGIGSSGEINALLLCALKDAGLDAFPVVMSLRSYGRIPISHPSLERFNYFIVGVNCGDDICYLDATRPYTDLNILPFDCLVNQALCIYPKIFSWVDLSNIANGRSTASLQLSFNENGQLSGKYLQRYKNETIYLFKNQYQEAKEESDYIRNLETKNKIQISDYNTSEVSDADNSFVNESYLFVDPEVALENNQTLAFNPLLFTGMTKNPFKQEDRKLPIEFPFLYSNRINIMLQLPNDYEFDEVPSSIKYTCDNDLVNFTYMVKQDGNTLNIAYIFNVNTMIIPANLYDTFRDFYAKMYAKTNEQVVIKKIAQ